MFAISEILFPRKLANKVSPDVAVDVVLKLSGAISARIQLQTSRRSGAGYREAVEVCRGGKPPSDIARSDRFRQDVHRRQCHPRAEQADAGDFAQQNIGRTTLLGVQAILPA